MNDDVLKEMQKAALAIGHAEWGSTCEHTAEEHADHVERSVKITAEHFAQEGLQKMHGLYVTGSGTVIGHTGTSPNSPTHARILTALWNQFVDEAMVAQGHAFALSADDSANDVAADEMFGTPTQKEQDRG